MSEVPLYVGRKGGLRGLHIGDFVCEAGRGVGGGHSSNWVSKLRAMGGKVMSAPPSSCTGVPHSQANSSPRTLPQAFA